MTKRLRVIVVDDEPLSLSLIGDYVTKTPGLELVATFSNPIFALDYINEHPVDLAFLDIHMPELSGLQLMKIIQQRCMIIVISAFSEYAVEGYNHNIIDYLLKPVTLERFLQAVAKAQEKLWVTFMRKEPPSKPSTPIDCLFIKSDSKIQKINLADISIIEGAGDYIVIYNGSDQIVTSQTMKSMEETLPSNRFQRVHKSYIIALDKIDHIERDTISIANRMIPISETYKEQFIQKISSY